MIFHSYSGWVDNWNGPTGIVSAVGKGIFHTIMCNEESVADFVPVDMVSSKIRFLFA